MVVAHLAFTLARVEGGNLASGPSNCPSFVVLPL